MVDQRTVAKDFDGVVGDYNEKIDGALSFTGMEHKFFINEKARLIDVLARRTFGDTTKLSVLDIGCGVGNYLGKLDAGFGSISGIDVSEQSIAKARADNPRATCLTYDGGKLPMPDASFDVAYAICVMHHVPPPGWPEFMTEMKRMLKPGGLGLVFEHNPLNPATQYVVRSCDIDKDAVLLWPRKLKRLFNDAGFDQVSARTIFSVPPAGAALQQMDHWLGAMPFGAQYYVAGRRSAGH